MYRRVFELEGLVPFFSHSRERLLDWGWTVHCAVTGSFIGLLFWILAVFLNALGGAQLLETHRISLQELFVADVLGGLMGGSLVGALYALTRWQLGAAAVGYVGMLPFSFLLVTASDKADSVTVRAMGVLVGSLFGAAIGWSLRRDEFKKGQQ